MSGNVIIEDDPAHPEGGHARLCFSDVRQALGQVTLGVEVLTDGFDYRGPRRLEVPAKQTDAGLECSVGPEVVGALKEGLAVNLALDELGKHFDVLWPVLRPLRAAARRSALSTRKARQPVIEERSPPEIVKSPKVPAPTQEIVTEENAGHSTVEMSQPVEQTTTEPLDQSPETPIPESKTAIRADQRKGGPCLVS